MNACEEQGALSADFVQRTVDEMQVLARASDPADRRRLATDFSAFQSRCPTIYQKACSPMSATDRAILNDMLDQMRSVEAGKTNHHDSSVTVGQGLFDRYVQPIVDEQKCAKAHTK